MDMSVVFCASNQVARNRVSSPGSSQTHRAFIWTGSTDGQPDGSRTPRVVGFLTGHDDWAERIDRSCAKSILRSWGVEPSVLDAPVAQVAKT